MAIQVALFAAALIPAYELGLLLENTATVVLCVGFLIMVAFLSWAVVVIMQKWLLLGRETPKRITTHSGMYSWFAMRYRAVLRSMVITRALALPHFEGTWLAILYHRLLGAQISWSALLHTSECPPRAPDGTRNLIAFQALSTITTW